MQWTLTHPYKSSSAGMNGSTTPFLRQMKSSTGSRVIGELRCARTRPAPGRGSRARRSVWAFPSSAQLARRIEVPQTTAHRWVGPDRPLPKGVVAGTCGPLQAHLHRVGLQLARKAFARADGSVDVAARLLRCSVMTARRWWRRLPESTVDRRVRADLSTPQAIRRRGLGLSCHEIGKRLACTRSAVKWRLSRV
jgi:hypothetical protein